jgi:UDP-N-acetylmuramoyl-tripeptide--D-alanyl-D-alanine ligase
MAWTLTLGQIRKILQTNPLDLSAQEQQKLTTGVSTDTRTLKPGEVFLALEGEKFDGHDFATLAIAKGAIALVVSRRLSLAETVPQLIVPDTLEAYQTLASWWRDRFNIPVIAVTGSVGKTTTKELLAAVLSTQGRVLKTEANYNNEIGVPKTLLELAPEDNYAVIEMAMRAAGEIGLLTEITRPTIGIITNVGTAHIGRLGSQKAIAQAKCELLAQMPDSAVAILNYDNKLLLDTAATVWQGKTITYGLTGGDIHGELIDNNTLRINGQDFPLPLPGNHNASNYLAAIATAQVLEIDINTFTNGLIVELPKGRSRRYQLANDVVILDETYNAGLESMLAALQLLKETPGKRHIAVLGTMKELGEHSAKFHQQVGEMVQQLQIDLLLVLVDEPETEAIAAAASGIPSECFQQREDLVIRLREIIQEGDRLLFKASNSVGLSQVVEQLRLTI